MRNHSNENEFDLHENGHVGETHFHMNGFAPRLVLKQRQRVTRKWPIQKPSRIRSEQRSGHRGTPQKTYNILPQQ